MTVANANEVASGVYRIPLSIVNAYMVGEPGGGDRSWVLVDAGMSLSKSAILREAARVYGKESRPAAIVLTHGHFDHVGSLATLAELWDVPVYAHTLELPYLTGRSDYPPPDPFVGGGAMSLMSPLYWRAPINLFSRVHALPAGAVPFLPGWRWIHTPGHTPGHISLFREDDRALIAGDAFVTTKQESAYAALAQPPVVHGPPAYFTCDWQAAEQSVRRLADLNPEVAATGHGKPLSGPDMRRDLHELADRFREVAVPTEGRYVRTPARADASGVRYTPPAITPPLKTILAAIGVATLVGFVTSRGTRL